jgi:uncharacterized protein
MSSAPQTWNIAQTAIDTALAGHATVPDDWMPATQVRAFVFEDPGLVWLEHYGAAHGFQPESSPYGFLDFITQKSREFQNKWIEQFAPVAIPVCAKAYEVRSAAKVRRTFELMQSGVPVISQPALWWAPERIYGTPDLLVHTSWIAQNFPDLLPQNELRAVARNLSQVVQPGHYVVFDIKFTTKLTDADKAKDLQNDSAQVRLYTYMLGQLQAYMPKAAFLVTRDRLRQPLPVEITSACERPLDDDLAMIRDAYVDIKTNGALYLPWTHEITKCNLHNTDERWSNAKRIIATENTPGRDPALLYRIGPAIEQQLAALRFDSLDSLLKDDPCRVPLERCKGLGPAYSKQIRAVLQANRSGLPVTPPVGMVPARKEFELFVDFEYFTNLNVDFDREWPDLKGCEMIFMIGVGWVSEGEWAFKAFTALAENTDQEMLMFEHFLNFLSAHTLDKATDPDKAALYHWSTAEVWQCRRAADRHNLPVVHPLRKLPWQDLQKVFLNGPCAVPGAWDFGLKPITKALGMLDPQLDPHWPGDVDEGLRAMVMGWRAYDKPEPTNTGEMAVLCDYLEADCRALWNVLRWLRRL